MELKLDRNVSYALALEGGGARGAYQIGAWRALREAGIKISAVSGTSVGALNGALIIMGDMELAESVWRDVRFSKVMDVDDDAMTKLIRGDLRELDLRSMAKELRGVLKNRGFDVTPLYNWIREVVSEPAIRQSDMELYIVTYSLTDQKVLELRAKELPEGDVWDMLLASSYLPVFKNEPLGGKRYADGGLRDVLPLHVLVENGYRNIIALRLYGIGIERLVHIPRTTRVHTVAPTEDLGGTLDFEPEVCRRNMLLGYYDTQRLLYGLRGEKYYIDARWSEKDAYRFLLDRVGDSQSQSGRPPALRELNESLLPALAKKLNAAGGYRDIALAWLESAALASGVEKYKVYTEAELLEKTDAEALYAPLKKLPRRRGSRLRPREPEQSAPSPEEDELNVCLINDSFPPVIDGVANAVVNYAQIIQDKYGRCAVATPEYPGAEDSYGFPVVRYPSADATKLVGYRIGNPFSPTTVSKLGGMGFNLIHSHCPATSTMLARTLRDVIHAPVVFTYHTKFDIDIANAIRSQRMQETAIRFLVNNVAACDEVWVVSLGAGENLRSLGYDGDYIVMPNGVDLSRGRASQEETAELSRTWALPEDRPLYLFIGRMMWYKGLRLILDALVRLKEAGENFCMAFIGDGHDRPEVEEYAYGLGLSKYCRFVGAVQNRNVIRAWYTRADLLLFPSTFDTNGLVVREAAACGLGSVLVDGSCAAEGVVDGETGILIAKEAESLAEVLRGGASRREEYGRIGQNAMDRLYVSWEESVAAAWERYHVVLDRWNSGELRRKKAPLDELFDRSAAAAQLIDDLRSQQDVLPLWKNHELGRVKDHLDRYQ